MPIANIEDMRRIEVRTEDELSRTVYIRLQNEQMITVSLEERDACELVLVLKGYFRLITGQTLLIDKEEAAPVEDLAPPYLSQHKVVPEKWSYVNQQQIKSICFAGQPMYQHVNRKTNGLYNTMGRQSKPPLMTGLSLDSNMNTSISNRNHQFKPDFSFDSNRYGSIQGSNTHSPTVYDRSKYDPNTYDSNSFDSNTYDLQSVMSMEILESGIIEARNDDVFRRVKEMQQLVESSEKYLTEQQHLAKLHEASEWQETSVDIESDSDSMPGDDAPGKLQHSDSLLLLTRGCHVNSESRQSFTNAAIEMLRSEINQSESDNDSLYTPHNSPKHKVNNKNNTNSKSARVSFGLHSPDTATNETQDLKSYLQQLKDQANGEHGESDLENISDLYVFDPEIIDLTLLPPPATPDELDSALPTPINVPPRSFADSVDKLNKLGVLHENLDLEEFLASVTVPPPTQKITPAVELTPEEIMSYIIPPPPEVGNSLENLAVNYERSTNGTFTNGRSTENKCFGGRCTGGRCTDVRCTDVGCTDVRCIDVRYANDICVDVRNANVKCADIKYNDIKCSDVRSLGNKFTVAKCTEIRFAEGKFTKGRFIEGPPKGRAPDNIFTEGTPIENRFTNGKFTNGGIPNTRNTNGHLTNYRFTGDRSTGDHLTSNHQPNNHLTEERLTESLPPDINNTNGINGVKRRNSNCSVKSNSSSKSNVIEYATVDRKGAFSCCTKGKTLKSETNEVSSDGIQLPPRRSSDEKPPERPPKNVPQERQRSHSLTSSRINSEFPPKLPPKGEINHQAPPHLFLPPKKPPLPPVPPLEVLRSRKVMVPQPKTSSEGRTAGIGSPHLQRNRNMYNELENNFGNTEEGKLGLFHSTAVSTPTSPYMGKLKNFYWLADIGLESTYK